MEGRGNSFGRKKRVMEDREIVERLTANEPGMVREFFFERCRPMLTYVGQYFCRVKESPEDLIGEFYEFLAADDWRRLRMFKFSCSLNSYVTIIATRYFQHKRDGETVSIEEHEGEVRALREEGTKELFFMEDVKKAIARMQPLDRFLIQRILIDGEKPGDILDEAAAFIEKDETVSTEAQDRRQLAGYVYTRYNRARKNLQKLMTAMGYGR